MIVQTKLLEAVERVMYNLLMKVVGFQAALIPVTKI